MPRRIASNKSCGRPTPIKYRGRSAGSAGTVSSSTRYIWSGVSPTLKPPDRIAGKIQRRQTLSAIQPQPSDRARPARLQTGLDPHGDEQRASGPPSGSSARLHRGSGSARWASATTWSSTMATSLPQRFLNSHGTLGAQIAPGRRPDGDRKLAASSVTSDSAARLKSLKAAAVGQDRAVPAHELRAGPPTPRRRCSPGRRAKW